MKMRAAFAAVILAVWAQNAAAAEPPVLRYVRGAENNRSLSQLPLTVAIKKGYFAREGLRIDFVTNNDSNSAAAEQGYNPGIERGGPGDMTTVSGGFFVHAVLNGSDAVAVSSQTNNPIYSLIVRPEIKTWADLKGKEITLTAPWDTITVTSRALLARHGIGPNDFKFKYIRNSDARLECMQNGECAAISAGQPSDIQAIKMGLGYHRLGMTNEAGPVIFNVEIVRREWARTHRDTLVRYIRASAAAMRFLNDPKNRPEVTSITRELTGEPPAVVDEMIAHYYDPKLRILPKQAEVDMASLQHLLDLIKQAGLYDRPMPPAARFVDLSFAQAAGVR
jgi:ABC-type nitrate/sulfonate/bicarbonate transport system substrate-binding protein